MSSFVQRINPVTGKSYWTFEKFVDDSEYEVHQSIARSLYADMLHDTDRNQKYYEALKYVIRKKRAQDKEIKILDIGTGTGLLSMMAATCGVQDIVACEAFPPIAAIAKTVLIDNGLSDKINIIPKSSLELIIGKEGDMSSKCNVLVAEVFDTELIGEGAIPTFNDAKDRLMEDDCIVIPERGKIYAAVAESEFLLYWNTFRPSFPLPNGKSVSLPNYVIECPGTNGVHDIQLSQLSPNDFKLLTEPVVVFNHEDDLNTDRNVGLKDKCIIYPD